MARQRRELDDQLADLFTMARGSRTNAMTTPAMAPVGPNMIEDDAIQNEHVSIGAIRLANLDKELTDTLADLAQNEVALGEAKGRLDRAEARLDDAFDTITVLPSRLEQMEIDARAAATDMSKVIFQSSKPQVRAGSEKDLWINTGAGNTPHRYDLAKKDWVVATDTAAVELAKTHANDLVRVTKTQILSAQDEAIQLAKTAAITAAAADAKAKTEAAEARVATVAAAQAKSMADTAQADAIAAAKVYADAQASGAGALALDAAKADATAKANDAKKAAIAAAALDATAKKEAAEATAAADAKAKADKALADAKTDATTKANNAKAAAITAAAADATTKASAAQAAAVTAADIAAKATAKSEAEAAEARAAVTAAADAKNQAAAAQAAAVTAAKAYTEAQASGAGTAALEAAKADATSKADAAKTAAIAAAALDATAKKEAAEATAALDAKTKADKALSDAKLDATSKANAAQAAAIKAAATDATTKADAAKAAAITAADVAAKAAAKSEAEAAEARVAIAAAADAKLKADAAQAAALAAAKTYADAEASGAGTAALNAAKADATSKANAAKQAAIDAAALDATAKKEDAERVAALDAKAKADKALVDAKADAKSKADAALAAAKTDSTTKADNALVKAEAFTVTKMNEVANSKNATSYSTSAPSDTATPGSLAGDTWRRKDAKGNIIGEWEWDGKTWTQRKTTSASLTAVDVGVLVAGSAKIIDAVAQSIASSTATIQEADIKNLRVTETSNMNELVARRVAANTGSYMNLYAENVTIGSASNYMADPSFVDPEMVKRRNASSTCTVTLSPDSDLQLSNTGTSATYFRPLGVAQSPAAFASWIPTKPGDVWRFKVSVSQWKGDGNWGVKFVGRTKDGAAYANPVEATNIPANASGDYEVVGTVPADCYWIMPEMRVFPGTQWVKRNSMVMEQLTDANLVVDGTIKARHMQLVSGNIFPDPKFVDADGYSRGLAPQAGKGRFGSHGLVVPSSTAQAGTYYGNNDRERQFAVSGGDSYRLSVWVKPAADLPATNSVAMYMKWSNPDTSVSGIFTTPSAIYNTVPLVAGEWAEISGVIPVPPEATKGLVGFYAQRSAVTEVTFSDPVVRPAVDASVMTDIVLATKITAGDPKGTRAEMSPQGFRVFARPANDAVGEATEVVRMGVAETDDYFAVSRADGTLAATISQDGKISGGEVYANESLYYQGNELQTIIDNMPRGVVANATRNTSSPVYSGAGAYKPYLHMTVPVEAGRMYRISSSNIHVMGTSSAQGNLHWAVDKPATVSSPLLQHCYTASTSAGFGMQTPIHFNRTIHVWWTGTLSLLVGVAALGNGTVKIVGDLANHQNFLMVEDCGKLPSDTGESLDGNATVPPVVRTYENTWIGQSSRSYQGNGQPYNHNAGKMYQGLSPAGYGNLSSACTFLDMTKELSGATINSIQVYFYFEHWYNNAGGTARISLIGKTLPATFQAGGLSATSTGWPKPGGRWVTLPSSLYNGFKTGQYGGVSLNGDNTYGSYGIASGAPKIKINYTK